jgi:molybdenum cofactor cytidylyltransferase
MPSNKLLLRDALGRTMLGRVAAAALASTAAETVVVTGYMRDEVTAAALAVPGGERLRFVHAPRYANGLSASLAAGIGAVPLADAVLVCLGDMPLITPAIIDAVIGAHDPASGRLIVVPTCGGAWGNPVLWDRRFFSELQALSGDAGARPLIGRHPGDRCEVEVGDAAVLTDFDTPAGFF